MTMLHSNLRHNKGSVLFGCSCSMTGKRGIWSNVSLFLNKKIWANSQDYVLIVYV